MKMKQRKERDFVKRICEELHFEVIVSRIEIIDVYLDKALYSVIFKDRFGEYYRVILNKNKPSIEKLKR